MTVFVHSWFRSSSTWLWAKFRSDPSLRAYYEPLNEELPLWTPELIRSRPAVAFKGDKHPALDRHYFDEYIDLISAGRLRFKPSLSYHRYVLLRDEQDEILATYLSGLIEDARSASKRPVLCFCRSQMRSLWISANFGGTHICQIRNPWDQWRSFGAHSYFYTQAARIALLLNDRVAGSFAHVSAVSSAPAGKSGVHFEVASIRKCFALIWLASTLQALASSEVVVDPEHIAASEGARCEIEAQLLNCGLAVDLSDCRPTVRPDAGRCELDGDLLEAAAAIQSHARGLLPFRPGAAEHAKLRFLSPRTAALLEGVLREIADDNHSEAKVSISRDRS